MGEVYLFLKKSTQLRRSIEEPKLNEFRSYSSYIRNLDPNRKASTPKNAERKWVTPYSQAGVFIRPLTPTSQHTMGLAGRNLQLCRFRLQRRTFRRPGRMASRETQTFV